MSTTAAAKTSRTGTITDLLAGLCVVLMIVAVPFALVIAGISLKNSFEFEGACKSRGGETQRMVCVKDDRVVLRRELNSWGL